MQITEKFDLEAAIAAAQQRLDEDIERRQREEAAERNRRFEEEDRPAFLHHLQEILSPELMEGLQIKVVPSDHRFDKWKATGEFADPNIDRLKFGVRYRKKSADDCHFCHQFVAYTETLEEEDQSFFTDCWFYKNQASDDDLLLFIANARERYQAWQEFKSRVNVSHSSNTEDIDEPAHTPAEHPDQRLFIATQLMAAMLVDDRIAWFKDAECFGNSDEAIADRAVIAADLLLSRLSK